MTNSTPHAVDQDPKTPIAIMNPSGGGTGVAHLDVKTWADERLPAGSIMAVYWRDGLPVGHRFLGREGRAAVAEDLARLSAIPPSPFSLSAAAPTATVVICTRDRPGPLAACLETLSRQTRRPDQVVVVDNGSRDGRTREAAEAAGVDYVLEARPGLDIARNAGARAAVGEIVAYTDDDVLLHPAWLERLVAAFDAPEIMAVTGLVLPAELETSAQIAFERWWSFGRGYERVDFGPDFFARTASRGCPAWRLGAGASMAFRRECFAGVGLFDERLDVGAAGCSGDSEFWHRILWKGHVVRYEPTSVAFHVHRRDMDGLRRQIHAYMRGHAAALMVQYERTGNLGELRRALVSMPVYYARRTMRRLLRRSPQDALLWVEIGGYLSGLRFYLATPKRAAGDRA